MSDERTRERERERVQKKGYIQDNEGKEGRKITEKWGDEGARRKEWKGTNDVGREGKMTAMTNEWKEGEKDRGRRER